MSHHEGGVSQAHASGSSDRQDEAATVLNNALHTNCAIVVHLRVLTRCRNGAIKGCDLKHFGKGVSGPAVQIRSIVQCMHGGI